MAWLPQPDGGRFELFGSGGGALVAKALTKLANKEVVLLGQIPMDVELREGSDSGQPLVATHQNSAAAQAIGQIATQIVEAGPKLVGKKLPLSSN
jgi:ATP-binding protein involved in chromosome partitioning